MACWVRVNVAAVAVSLVSSTGKVARRGRTTRDPGIRHRLPKELQAVGEWVIDETMVLKNL